MEMKDNMTPKTDQAQPFFARFLEGQDFPKVSTDVKAGKGGGQHVTMKWPSDDDEGGEEW